MASFQSYLIVIGFLVAVFAEPLCQFFAPWWLARLALRPLGRPKMLLLDREAFETLAPAHISSAAGYRDHAARQVDWRSLPIGSTLLGGAFHTRVDLAQGVIFVWKKARLGSNEQPGYARIDLAVRDHSLVASVRYVVAPVAFLICIAATFFVSLAFGLASLFYGPGHLADAVGGSVMMAVMALLGWGVLRQSRLAIAPGVEAAIAELFAAIEGEPVGGVAQRHPAQNAPAFEGEGRTPRVRVAPGGDAAGPRVRVAPGGDAARPLVRLRVGGLGGEADEATELDPLQAAVRQRWFER